MVRSVLFQAEIMIVPRGVACGTAPPSLLEQVRLKVTNADHMTKLYLKPHLSLELPIVKFDSENASSSLRSHPNLATGPIVIISRRKAHERRIINEMDIVTHVYQKYPAIAVSIFEGNTPLVATIKLFQSARAVIAPHGAGLLHILWMRAGTAILEVFPMDSYIGCYQAIAQYGGIQGFVYFANGRSTESSMRGNMTIFEQLIEQMMRGRY